MGFREFCGFFFWGSVKQVGGGLVFKSIVSEFYIYFQRFVFSWYVILELIEKKKKDRDGVICFLILGVLW